MAQHDVNSIEFNHEKSSLFIIIVVVFKEKTQTARVRLKSISASLLASHADWTFKFRPQNTSQPRLKVKRFGHVKTFYECDKINHFEFTSLARFTLEAKTENEKKKQFSRSRHHLVTCHRIKELIS